MNKKQRTVFFDHGKENDLLDCVTEDSRSSSLLEPKATQRDGLSVCTFARFLPPLLWQLMEGRKEGMKKEINKN